MQPVLWNPFRDLDDVFQSLRRGIGRGLPVEGGGAMAQWAPAVDISEKEGEYLIKGELPGVKREDVDISVQNGVLTLSGERRFEKEDKDEKHHRIERSFGSFSRSFSLPENVDADQIKAEYTDGVVTVHLPKVAPAKPEVRKISVG
ncbi:MAG: Hsp20/alpha crystallin family protein [Nevskiales bacterium]|nr:Hsp20/alpha crystallin family protein [Nevskiales bacterium]